MSNFNLQLASNHNPEVIKPIQNFVSKATHYNGLPIELIEAVITKFGAEDFLTNADNFTDKANGFELGQGGFKTEQDLKRFYIDNKTSIIMWLENLNAYCGAYDTYYHLLADFVVMKNRNFSLDDGAKLLDATSETMDRFDEFAQTVALLAISEVCYVFNQIQVLDAQDDDC